MKKPDSVYIGKKILLTTMHKKELYLKAPCEKILGASLSISDESINTDALGTFSGEIERKGNQKETVLKKCFLGLKGSGFTLGVANEGSFGPHPQIPFIASSLETLVFVDTTRKVEIFETMLFKETNYRHTTCTNLDDLTNFFKYALFPSHGLIIRPNLCNDKTILFKGIQDITKLKESISLCAKHSDDKLAHIETDMRAHMNPTRGLNLKKLGIRLFRRLSRLCPLCHTPGWGITDLKKGRPCLICQCPTELASSYIWTCIQCPYQKEQRFPECLHYANPSYCNVCNP
ncbi:MAG: DUF6671 family protein [Chlamydiota bacterium]